MPFNIFVSLVPFPLSPQSQRSLLRDLGVAWEEFVPPAATWTKAARWLLTTFAFHHLYWRSNLWCHLKPNVLQCCPGEAGQLREFLHLLHSKLISVPLKWCARFLHQAGWNSTDSLSTVSWFPFSRSWRVSSRAGSSTSLALQPDQGAICSLSNSQFRAIMLMSLTFSFLILVLCVFFFFCWYF